MNPWFHPSQTGFRPYLGTHDCLWLLRRVINRSPYDRGLPDYVLTVDLRKAFDRVDQTTILTELAQAFPSKKAQVWVRNFLHNRPIQLSSTLPGWTPNTYYNDKGVPQGSILGPVLFNIVMAKLAKTLEQETSARFAIYADDITIWTEGRDYSSTSDMLVELQAAVNSLEACIPKLGLELAPEKTELLVVKEYQKAPRGSCSAVHWRHNYPSGTWPRSPPRSPTWK